MTFDLHYLYPRLTYPNDVELLVSLVDFQLGRDPDTEDTGVQTQYADCDANLEVLCSLSIDHQD